MLSEYGNIIIAERALFIGRTNVSREMIVLVFDEKKPDLFKILKINQEIKKYTIREEI